MRELAFVGLSEDGSSLVLSSTDGTRYTVPCDERIEAALRRDRSRLGQLEIPLDGTSPRDIQLRIRHGQSPDDIAVSSGLTIDRVMRFAGPVLAEREHMATQARETELRHAGSARTLEQTVVAALEAGHGDPDTLEWDAWRREDGTWSLFVSWEPVAAVATGATAALWVYDAAVRTLVADDVASSWLLGDRPTEEVPLEGRRLLTPVPSGDDLDHWDDDEQDPDAAFTAIVEREPGADIVDLMDRPPAEPADESPLHDLYDTLPGLKRPEKRPRLGRRRTARPAPPADGDAEKGTKARATVPSWDEILFGARDPEV